MPVTPSPDKIQRSSYDAWTTLPAAGRPGEPPELDGYHSERAQRLWVLWWSTPMATRWIESDAPQLERLLTLFELFWSGEYPASTLPEIRQGETAFGLSPAARRKLYWRVEGVDTPAADAALDAPTSETPLPKAGGGDDPRKLRAV
jgi:hypothetical protein